MWDKLSFRLKITVIFSVSLIVLTVSLTALSLMNVRQNISNPMEMNIIRLENFEPNSVLFLRNDDVSYDSPFAIEQLREEPNISLIDRDGLHNFHVSAEDMEMLLQGHGDFITIDQLQEQLSATQRDFRQYSFWVAGAVIVLGSLGAYLVAGVVVRPIKKLSVSVEGIEADKLDVSLPLPKSQDEILQLTVAFNGMLDKLHRSFESKQLFAQNAAHELKTPLTIIRANMEALAMDDDLTTDDYEEVFVEVKNSTERMIGLVEGLLAMGKSPDEADMTDFKGTEIFGVIFRDLEDDIRLKRLNVQIVGDLTMKGEKTLLCQAFFNLIHNAVRYNVEGGSVVVTMSENRITIGDTGIGIPSESLGRLFDPFYCVDKSRSKRLGGNGLGLAITKNILDAHQIGIHVTSEVEVGTIVTIHI